MLLSPLKLQMDKNLHSKLLVILNFDLHDIAKFLPPNELYLPDHTVMRDIMESVER